MHTSTNAAHKRKRICAEHSSNEKTSMHSSDSEVDVSDFETRDALPVRANLLNFEQGPRGFCNKRDGTVLGRHPGCTIPDGLGGAEALLVSFFLHHDIGEEAMKMYLGRNAQGKDSFSPPTLIDARARQMDADSRVAFPIKSNEQWIGSQSKQVHWKKKNWVLSRHMRKIAEVKFPQWVIVVTPRENGILNYSKSVRSPPFEVRSKDQPRVSAFASGRNIKKRRTPETFRAEQVLKSVQTDILALTDTIRNKEGRHDECKTRLDFALALSNADPRCAHIVRDIKQYMRFHKM